MNPVDRAMSRQLWYTLDGHTPVPCDAREANRLLGDPQARRVALDEWDRYRVSTIFLVLDHQLLGDGPQRLFETIVFRRVPATGEEVELDCVRYATWDEAAAGHAAIVGRLKMKGERHGTEDDYR